MSKIEYTSKLLSRSFEDIKKHLEFLNIECDMVFYPPTKGTIISFESNEDLLLYILSGFEDNEMSKYSNHQRMAAAYLIHLRMIGNGSI